MLNLITVLASLVLLNACASSTAQIREEAVATQQPQAGSTAAKSNLGAILDSDATLSSSERQTLSSLIDQAYQADDQFEVLINQKKALLLTELLAERPDSKRIFNIKNAIYKTQRERTASFMKYIDKMSQTMRVHPTTSTPMMREFMRSFAR
jgi:hypothetical protein